MTGLAADLATLRSSMPLMDGHEENCPCSVGRFHAALDRVEAELSRLREERDAATMKVLLETRHPSDQVKIDEWWAARSEVKIDGNSRAAYVLQRDVAWERAEAAEARLGEARQECARLEEENADLLNRLEISGELRKQAEAMCARLQQALRPFVEEYDFHAADYLAELVDGEEVRVLTARTIALLIEHQRAAREALAGQPTAAEGPDTPADSQPEEPT